MKRWTVALVAVGVLAIAAAVAMGQHREPLAPPPPKDVQASKPDLALLTSLPILFGERFGLGAVGSALGDELARHFTVVGIPVADRASLAPYRLLLMAHPRAQPAEALVDLDTWVRQGGRLLLLADPHLDWPSDRPLGDKLRPPPDFADTGLLDHWGLVLSGPTEGAPASVSGDGLTLDASSTGRLATRSADCAVDPPGVVARCRLGKGRVTVVADADFVNVDRGAGSPSHADANLSFVSRELARLAR